MACRYLFKYRGPAKNQPWLDATIDHMTEHGVMVRFTHPDSGLLQRQEIYSKYLPERLHPIESKEA